MRGLRDMVVSERAKRWSRAAVAAVALYATISVSVVFFEGSMIYFPTRYPDGEWDLDVVTAGSECAIEDCFFEAADGVRLHSWWSRSRRSAADADTPVDRRALIWFHGNAGNLSHRAELLLALTRPGLDVMIVGYRGYGRSDGRPSEAGLYRDAMASWQYATTVRRVPARHVVLFGESLGGAVAVELARQVEPAGLIVQSSFSSVPAMAAYHYPVIPGWLISTRMDSLAKVAELRCPKLFIHSRADEIVPFSMGEQLFDAAAEPKRLVEIADAGHNETWLVAGEAYIDVIHRFVEESTAGSRPDAAGSSG